MSEMSETESKTWWFLGFKSQKFRSQYNPFNCRFYGKKPPTSVILNSKKDCKICDIGEQLELNEIEVISGIVNKIFNHNIGDFIDYFDFRNGKEKDPVRVLVGERFDVPQFLIST